MDAEVLALLVRAKDEASAEFGKIEHSIGRLASAADLGGRAMSGLHSILSGIGAGIGIGIFLDLQNVIGRIIDSIPSLIGQGQAFAGVVHDISEATGASAQSASQFVGQLDFLGISTDNLAMRLGVLSKGIIAHEGELNKLGISIRDSNGNYLDAITIVNRARDAVNGMTDGISKTKLATELFGRAGADMIDWLNLSNAQVAELDRKLGALGVTMDEKTVQEARAATREGNLLNLAMQGFGNTIMANVVPSLITAIDSIVNFVQSNGQAIATFASEVVNFVLGMISALTGAQVQTVSFTSTMDSLGSSTKVSSAALQNAAESQKKNAGESRAAKAALEEQTKAIDAQLASLTALDKAEQTKFEREMSALSAQMGAQAKAIDAAATAHRLDEQRASLSQQLADAQEQLAKAQAGPSGNALADQALQLREAQTALDAALAGKGGVVDQLAVDKARQRIADLQAAAQDSAASQVDAVQSAQDRIAQIRQQQADLEQGVADDTRKAQIQGVQDYIASITKAETEWTSKKGLLEQLKRDQAMVASQMAADKERGDAQAVADDQIKLEALHTAMTRTEEAARNKVKEDALTAEKKRLEDLKAAMAAAGAAVTPVLTDPIVKGAGVAGAAIEALSGTLTTGHGGPRGSGASTSLASAMDSARAAGIQFGQDVKAAIDEATHAVGDLLTAINGLMDPLNKALTGLQYLTDPAFRAKVDAAAKSQGKDVGNPLTDLLGGLGDRLNFIATGGKSGIPGMMPSHAEGGIIPPGTWGMTGERGPEPIFGGQTGVTVVPHGSGGVTFAAGSIIVQGAQDPAATAQAVMLAIKRELTRQNMSFSGGF